ncbi:hypothetical protein V1477_000208 [Vespula maculifrons]|uniref:DUF4485 domain-containing protein n=3 Tax=Vespula TaxID=7451 RepID=A0A834KIP0_VESPE|nr:hypothetical protein HZH66_011994 [Vespula vulgaris]KAF7406617.1 hypothetical protein H0235_014273 [Vespula pensylvanica]
MTKVYNTEFKEALREIAQRVAYFNSPHDRVRIVEWSRRLAGIPDESDEGIKNRNDYVQLLKIMTRGGRLHGIFLDPPPDNDEIPSLAESMCNFLCSKCKDLPNAGPLEPIISRKTPDGCAYISLRKIENKGILCYLAVSPDGLTMPKKEQ